MRFGWGALICSAVETAPGPSVEISLLLCDKSSSCKIVCSPTFESGDGAALMKVIISPSAIVSVVSLTSTFGPLDSLSFTVSEDFDFQNLTAGSCSTSSASVCSVSLNGSVAPTSSVCVSTASSASSGEIAFFKYPLPA